MFVRWVVVSGDELGKDADQNKEFAKSCRINPTERDAGPES